MGSYFLRLWLCLCFLCLAELFLDSDLVAVGPDGGGDAVGSLPGACVESELGVGWAVTIGSVGEGKSGNQRFMTWSSTVL